MKYRVTVAYQGQKTYLVEAPSQPEAERIAGELSAQSRHRATPIRAEPLSDLRQELERQVLTNGELNEQKPEQLRKELLQMGATFVRLCGAIDRRIK